jgi:hypothetical protein
MELHSLEAGQLKWYLDQSMALESTLRAIKAEEEAKAEAAKEFNGRIAALRDTKNTIMGKLEKFRLGQLTLDLDGNETEPLDDSEAGAVS